MSEYGVGQTPQSASDWCIYCGTGEAANGDQLADRLTSPPPWHRLRGEPPPGPGTPSADDYEAERRLGTEFHLTEDDVDPREIDMVNASLFLRRSLLVTGKPGSGRSALAYRIARDLHLGQVLRWSMTSRTTLQSGLHEYDANGRAQVAVTRRAGANGSTTIDKPAIGVFIRLGPLGTAFLPTRTPRVLLIDELDKSDPDLPNDLLSIFEDAEFGIPELERIRANTPSVQVFTSDRNGSATLTDGPVACAAFPVIAIISNGEREFPAAFLRRCLRLEMREPDANQLAAMVANHVLDRDGAHSDRLIQDIMARSTELDGLPADRSLEAVYLATSGAYRKNGPESATSARRTVAPTEFGALTLSCPAGVPDPDFAEPARPADVAAPLDVDDLALHDVAESVHLAAVMHPQEQFESPTRSEFSPEDADRVTAQRGEPDDKVEEPDPIEDTAPAQQSDTRSESGPVRGRAQRNLALDAGAPAVQGEVSVATSQAGLSLHDRLNITRARRPLKRYATSRRAGDVIIDGTATAERAVRGEL